MSPMDERLFSGLPQSVGLREHSESLFEAALESSYDSVLITDANLDHPTIVYVNPAFCRMTGYSPDEILGRTPAILQGERTEREVTRALRKALEAGRSFEGRTVNYRKNGEPFHIEWRTSPVLDDDGRTTHYIAIQRDVTSQVRQVRRLRRLAEIDGLTRLFARDAGESALGDEVARAREENTPLSLILLDIDHFKRINDEHGHAVGDHVLERVASVVDARIRGQDLAVRWGGEEFVVVLRDTGLEGAERVAEALREMIASTSFQHGIEATISAGVAELVEGESEDSLVGRADKAMYAAKSGGRNRVETAGNHD
ncbi:MAG: sensor domain-containing diguanylate cyclase [Candidatus Wenzhouxiangella sp. M2_3B_020]